MKFPPITAIVNQQAPANSSRATPPVNTCASGFGDRNLNFEAEALERLERLESRLSECAPNYNNSVDLDAVLLVLCQVVRHLWPDSVDHPDPFYVLEEAETGYFSALGDVEASDDR